MAPQGGLTPAGRPRRAVTGNPCGLTMSSESQDTQKGKRLRNWATAPRYGNSFGCLGRLARLTVFGGDQSQKRGSDAQWPWEKRAPFLGWLSLKGNRSPKKGTKGATGQVGGCFPFKNHLGVILSMARIEHHLLEPQAHRSAKFRRPVVCRPKDDSPNQLNTYLPYKRSWKQGLLLACIFC